MEISNEELIQYIGSLNLQIYKLSKEIQLLLEEIEKLKKEKDGQSLS